MSGWTAEQISDQSGRTAVVTGANSGLGLVTARELAKAGATVVATARSTEKAQAAAEQIAGASAGAKVEPKVLDLGDLSSVRDFAATTSAEHPTLDLLVNNAGVMMPPRELTADGFELQFGTNHLGHFALTGLLLEALSAGPDARVVTVSSLEHKPGKIDFDDLESERSYAPRSAYQRSKFANAVFGLELERRLREAGLPIRSMLAHPGYSATNLQSSGPTGPMKAVLAVGNRIFAQGAAQGALPQLYAATEPSVEGGSFIGPDGFQEFRGSPQVVEPVGRARDADTALRLWEVSEELTGVTYLSG